MFRGPFSNLFLSLMLPLEAMICGYIAAVYPVVLVPVFAYFFRREVGAYHAFFLGLGYFTQVHWVVISVHDFAQSSWWLAYGLAGLLMVYCASFWALCGYGEAQVRRCYSPGASVVICAGIWTLGEALRASLFAGFPWLVVGFLQTQTLLLGWIPWVGLYGVTFVTFLGVFCLSARCWYAVTVWLLVTLALLYPYHWTVATGAPLPVAVVQVGGGEAARHHLQVEDVEASISHYLELTEGAEGAVVIWPEGAVPMSIGDAADFLEATQRRLALRQQQLLTGIFDVDQYQVYNSMLLLGEPWQVYRKHILVPFGEYFPLGVVRQLFSFLSLPMTDLQSGPRGQPPLMIRGVPVAPLICYEIAFPYYLQQQLASAHMAVVLNDNHWFGHSIAKEQMIEMARFAAMMTQKSIIVANNNGLSQWLDRDGHAHDIAPMQQSVVQSMQVPAYEGWTPVVYIGERMMLLMIFGLCVITGWICRKKGHFAHKS